MKIDEDAVVPANNVGSGNIANPENKPLGRSGRKVKNLKRWIDKVKKTC